MVGYRFNKSPILTKRSKALSQNTYQLSLCFPDFFDDLGPTIQYSNNILNIVAQQLIASPTPIESLKFGNQKMGRRRYPYLPA